MTSPAINLKQGRAYKTRGGHRVDVLKTGLISRDGYSVAAVLWSQDRTAWQVASYRANGKYSAIDNLDHALDIVDDWIKLKVLT